MKHVSCGIHATFSFGGIIMASIMTFTFSPRTISVDDAIFQTAILSISRHHTEINLSVFENGVQIGSETCIFYSKISIRKFDLACDPRLTWPLSVNYLHWVRFQNGFDFWILRAKVTINHVPHARKTIFDVGGLSWPDLNPRSWGGEYRPPPPAGLS